MLPAELRDRKGGGVEGMEGKLNGNHLRLIARVVSRGQNELIGEFKMVAGDSLEITITTNKRK